MEPQFLIACSQLAMAQGDKENPGDLIAVHFDAGHLSVKTWKGWYVWYNRSMALISFKYDSTMRTLVEEPT